MSSIFNRKSGDKKLRINFYVVSEGENSEEGYFRWIKRLKKSDKQLVPIRHKSAGIDKLIRIARKDKRIKADDEVWIVLDRDEGNHTLEQFAQLEQWRKESCKNHHVAITTPLFEFWLLLHFRDKVDVEKSKQPDSAYFQRIIPGYSKSKEYSWNSFTYDAILNACRNIKRNYCYPECSAPDSEGSSIPKLLTSLWGKDFEKEF